VVSCQKLVLASTSPRRINLLKEFGIPFEAIDPGDAEKSVSHDPVSHVWEHAVAKAEAVAKKHMDRLILAADTVVVLDDKILEKPRSKQEAKAMLSALCGQTHTVISAVALIQKDTNYEDIRTKETRVTMKKLGEEEIEAYVATGEPMDKAGSYAAQGVGAFIIEKVEGCFYNVVGLPMSLIYDMLRDAGIDPLAIRRQSI
jgi:septum formation protein